MGSKNVIAYYRRALLTAVALVAITVPMGVTSGLLASWLQRLAKSSPPFKGDELLELSKWIPEAKGVYTTLKSIVDPEKTKIGKFTVEEILRLADEAEETRDEPPSEHDCQYDAIATRANDFTDCNENLVLNVFNLIYPRLMRCGKKIELVYRNNQNLAKLNEKELEDSEEIGGLLRLIEYKEEVKIGGWSVKTILYQATRTEFTPKTPLKSCTTIGLVLRTYIEDDRELLVRNLHNFDSGHEKLLQFCAQNLKEVFEYSVKKETSLNERTKLDEYYDTLELALPGPKEDEIEFYCSRLLKSYHIVDHIRHATRVEGPETTDEYVTQKHRRATVACLTFNDSIKPVEYYRSLLRLSRRYEFDSGRLKLKHISDTSGH